MREQKKAKEITCYPLLQGSENAMGLYTADPMGSYTGVPLDPDDEPVQDADDL